MPCTHAVYTMVKFGGVRNHLLATWTPEDLAACADLNLPCADVSSWLPHPPAGRSEHTCLAPCWLCLNQRPPGCQRASAHVIGTPHCPCLPACCHRCLRAQEPSPAVTRAGSSEAPAAAAADMRSRAGFAAASWLKPALALRTLRRGVAVMVADADVAYAPKPLWASYQAFLGQAGADGAFMQELPREWPGKGAAERVPLLLRMGKEAASCCATCGGNALHSRPCFLACPACSQHRPLCAAPHARGSGLCCGVERVCGCRAGQQPTADRPKGARSGSQGAQRLGAGLIL